MATTSRRILSTVDELLEAVKHLPPADLHEFQRQFTVWSGENNGINGASSTDRDEDALLAVIRENAALAAADQRRFNRLRRRRQAGTLTAPEEKRLQELWGQVERMNAVRLEALAELARRRGTDVRTLMRSTPAFPRTAMSSERVPRRLRLRAGARAGWRCEYCRSPAAFSTQPFEADHIVPSSKGGPTTLANLALSCGCNSYKGDRIHARDPRTGRSVRLFHPRRQRWQRHFAWSWDFLRVLGRTACGRATIEALHMNRPELFNLRRVLHLVGEHPPSES